MAWKPSPRAAARRYAGSLRPPTQIGMGCAGFGCTFIASRCTNSPSEVDGIGSPARRAARRASRPCAGRGRRTTDRARRTRPPTSRRPRRSVRRPPRQRVEAGERVGECERVVLRHHEHAGAEPDAFGRRRSPGEREQRVVEVRRRVVLRGGDGDVVADPHVGEPERLGEARGLGDRIRARSPAELGQMDSDAHDCRPYAVRRARITVPRIDFQEAGDVEASSFVREPRSSPWWRCAWCPPRRPAPSRSGEGSEETNAAVLSPLAFAPAGAARPGARLRRQGAPRLRDAGPQREHRVGDVDVDRDARSGERRRGRSARWTPTRSRACSTSPAASTGRRSHPGVPATSSSTCSSTRRRRCRPRCCTTSR